MDVNVDKKQELLEVFDLKLRWVYWSNWFGLDARQLETPDSFVIKLTIFVIVLFPIAVSLKEYFSC